MHKKSAKYHDLIYQFQNFRSEADTIIGIIEREFPSAHRLLDVACGPHQHAITLRERFVVDGIDLNEEFLSIAKLKNPEGRYVSGDMRSFELRREYDVVICLSSSIGYVQSYQELVSTLDCFVRHLVPDGIVVIEPWFTPETWKSGKVSIVVGESPELKVARVSRRTHVDRHSVMNFFYLVATPDNVETFSEAHHLTLFTQQEMMSAFDAVGLSATHSETYSKGRGLYVARRK